MGWRHAESGRRGQDHPPGPGTSDCADSRVGSPGCGGDRVGGEPRGAARARPTERAIRSRHRLGGVELGDRRRCVRVRAHRLRLDRRAARRRRRRRAGSVPAVTRRPPPDRVSARAARGRTMRAELRNRPVGRSRAGLACRPSPDQRAPATCGRSSRRRRSYCPRSPTSACELRCGALRDRSIAELVDPRRVAPSELLSLERRAGSRPRSRRRTGCAPRR